MKGVYYGTQLAIHFMRKNKVPGGNIVVTASASSLYPHECYIEYSGSKAAVGGYGEHMSRDKRTDDGMARFGISFAHQQGY